MNHKFIQTVSARFTDHIYQSLPLLPGRTWHCSHRRSLAHTLPRERRGSEQTGRGPPDKTPAADHQDTHCLKEKKRVQSRNQTRVEKELSGHQKCIKSPALVFRSNKWQLKSQKCHVMMS